MIILKFVLYGGMNNEKWVCQVCGYVYEGEAAPEYCPQCKAPASKFVEMKGEMTWAAEHFVGVAKDVPEDIKEDLRANFNGECSEVGMYLAMSRVAFREGYPEIGLYWEKLLLKKQNMLLNLLNCSAKLLPTAPKRTLKCA